MHGRIPFVFDTSESPVFIIYYDASTDYYYDTHARRLWYNKRMCVRTCNKAYDNLSPPQGVYINSTVVAVVDHNDRRVLIRRIAYARKNK
jgi:hypothetical protein